MRANRPVPIRKNDVRRKLLLIIFAIYGLCVLLMGFYSLNMGARAISVAAQLQEQPWLVPIGYMRSLDLWPLFRLLLAIPLCLLSFFFLFWLGRAYANMNRITQDSADHHYGWAVGSWFIPLLNIYWPLTFIREMIAKGGTVLRYFSRKDLAAQHHIESLDRITLIWWSIWWIIRIASAYLTTMFNPERNPNAGPAELATFFKLSGYAYFIELIPLVLGIIVVYRIGKFENAFQKLWDSGEYMERWHDVMESKGLGGSRDTWFDKDSQGEVQPLENPFENKEKR